MILELKIKNRTSTGRMTKTDRVEGTK